MTKKTKQKSNSKKWRNMSYNRSNLNPNNHLITHTSTVIASIG